MADSDHRIQLDGLRFFSFLAVFLTHSDIQRFWFGTYGVSLFFVISGFLITRILISAEDRPRMATLKAFYARRFLRIFPAYYVVLGIAAVCLTIPHVTAFFLYLMNWGAFALSWLRPDSVPTEWRPMHAPGIHFWSLCVEEQFYLIFPLMFLGLDRKKRVPFLLGLWALTIVLRVAFAIWLPQTTYGFLPIVCGEYLLAGCLGAVLLSDSQALSSLQREKFQRMAAAWFFPLGLAIICGLVLLFPPAHPSIEHVIRPPHTQTLYAVGFLLMVLGLWETKNRALLGFFKLRPLTYLGKISYGLYLIHLFTWPLYDWLCQKTPGIADVGPYAGHFILTVLLAIILWHAVEEPILHFKARFKY